jgi:hypothetical protein
MLFIMFMLLFIVCFAPDDVPDKPVGSFLVARLLPVPVRWPVFDYG